MKVHILKSKINKIVIGFIFILLFFVFNNLVISLLSFLGLDLTKLPLIPRQIVATLISLIFPILMIITYRKDLIKDFKKIKDNFRKYLEVSILAYVIGMGLMVISNLIIQLGFNQQIAGNEQGVRELINSLPIYMTISACFVGPFQEEMIFRKIFKDIIENKVLFVIISALVFGSLHVIGNTNSFLEFLYIIPYGVLGGTFAYIYSKTDNIWVPIIIHVAHNTILVAIQLLAVI